MIWSTNLESQLSKNVILPQKNSIIFLLMEPILLTLDYLNFVNKKFVEMCFLSYIIN